MKGPQNTNDLPSVNRRTLKGKFVTLLPLAKEHIDGLTEVGLDGSIWSYTVDRITSREEMAGFVRAALRDEMNGTALPFAIRDNASDRIVGSTRFGNIDHPNRKAEIGWTWVSPPWQRTAVNTESKRLLLQYAFEEMRLVRVEFKTDFLNLRSRAAILRIGATEEGTLRRHMLTHTGRFRDTVYFSILDDEWPSVTSRLLEKLASYQ